jgi:DUF917 family protein
MSSRKGQNMFTEINANNLNALCWGSSFLGSGGGGDQEHLRPTVQRALSKWGPIPLLTLADLKDEDLVAAMILFGAVLPLERRQTSMLQMRPVLDMVIKDLGKPLRALMPVEVGGANALTPFCVAGDFGLPVLDGDLMGRAFPEISMISPNVFDMSPKAAYIGDLENGRLSMLMSSSYTDLEAEGRAQVEFYPNSTVLLIPIVLTGREAKNVALPGTVSQAIRIGMQVGLDDLIQMVDGQIRCEGTIREWTYELKGGFLMGKLVLQTKEKDIIHVKVKNENLLLTDAQHNALAKSPDIISILRKHDLKPILSDNITVGEEVVCITCKGPDLWYTDKGLSLSRATVATL